MRTFEIIAALIVAAIVFVVLKVLGLLIKFALIAALLGFVAGLLLARLFRRRE
jgi:membrane associated rhomboid family serine protease